MEIRGDSLMDALLRKLTINGSSQVDDSIDNDSLIDPLVDLLNTDRATSSTHKCAQHGAYGLPLPRRLTSWCTPSIRATSHDQRVAEPGAKHCTTGKTVHASPQAAWSTLTAVVKHRHRKPKFWHRGKPGVYRCAMCGGYHTTSADRGEGE